MAHAELSPSNTFYHMYIVLYTYIVHSLINNSYFNNNNYSDYLF